MNLIGQDPSEIRKSVETDLAISEEALKQFSTETGTVTYQCRVSITFTICYGHVTVDIKFKDNHEWEFEADFFGGGLNYVTGSGLSVWPDDFEHPEDGEKMKFEIVSASATFGCIQMFFWREGEPILGGFTILAGGAGLLGGGGTGTWKRK